MERQRYILVYYSFERLLKEEEIRRIFTNQLNRLYGIKGGLDMGIFLSWMHPEKPFFIMRSSHTNMKKFFCVTFFISDFNGKNLNFIPLKTAGSIKKIKNYALSQNWENLLEAQWDNI